MTQPDWKTLTVIPGFRETRFFLTERNTGLVRPLDSRMLDLRGAVEETFRLAQAHLTRTIAVEGIGIGAGLVDMISRDTRSRGHEVVNFR